MKFLSKSEPEDMWSVNWGDSGDENFLCMTDDERKASVIVNALQYVVNRSPSMGGLLENVRDPE